MVFSDSHPNPTLRGQSKGIKQVLIERDLWRPGKYEAGLPS